MAEELTRSLEALADRGTPRGAGAVLEASRQQATLWLEPWWVRRPALVAAAACLSTLAVLGGSLLAGLAYRDPRNDVGSGWVQLAVPEGDAESSTTSLLVGAVALTIVFVVLILRNHLIKIRKEKRMATMLESQTATAERIATVEKRDRRLLWTVLALALALVALGAFVVFDLASTSETAANAEVSQLYEDYTEVWLDFDGDSFFELVTDDYTFSTEESSSTAGQQAAAISVTGGFDDIEQVGDHVVMTDGSEYYVATANRITDNGVEYVGVSVMRLVDDGSGLKVAQHHFIGNR